MAFDRAKERSAIAVAITEDDQIISVVKRAAEVGVNPVQNTSTAQLTRSQLADAFGTIYSNQLVVGTVLMHPKRYADVLKFGTGGSTDFDQVSVNTIIETGLFGVIYGARLLVTTRVPVGAADGYATGTCGSVYVCTTPDKLGRLPERKAVEVKIFDDIMQQQYACLCKNEPFRSDPKMNNSVNSVDLFNVLLHNKGMVKTIPSQACEKSLEGVETKDGITRSGRVVNCEFCGKEVYRPNWMLRTREHFYCCNQHANKANGLKPTSYQKNRPKKIKVPKVRAPEVYKGQFLTCICGKEIYVLPYKIKGSNTSRFFCSTKCANKANTNLETSYQKNKSKDTLQKLSASKLGPKNPQWKGGNRSKINYSLDYTPALRTKIRRRDNFMCQWCNVSEDQITTKRKVLTIHHIDYDKHNNSENNLITLCQKCNCLMNTNRKHYPQVLSKLVNAIVRTAQRCAEPSRNVQALSEKKE